MEYIKAITTEDDYIEKNGAVEELTVTITLCEYRRLIEENVRLNTIAEQHADEIESLEKQKNILTEHLFACKPDLAADILAFSKKLFNNYADDAQDEEGDAE